MAGCHSFCLFFIFFITYIHSFHIHTIHLSVAIRWGLSPNLDQHQNGKSYPDRHQNDVHPQNWLLYSFFVLETSIKVLYIGIGGIGQPILGWNTSLPAYSNELLYRFFVLSNVPVHERFRRLLVPLSQPNSCSPVKEMSSILADQ